MPDADWLLELLRPDGRLLLAGLALDLALGDPRYRWHPVRLMGATLTWGEAHLRNWRVDGYGGGILLFVGLALGWIAITATAVVAVGAAVPRAGWVVHLLLVYSLIALGDLLRHVWRVEQAVARDDLPGAHEAISHLVGRDTSMMDGAACRRAAVESLSENLTDGVISPIFWYALAGVPGLVLFKVVSTMDSMVGYKTPRYRRFGWCGARLDDAMNYVPARATWLVVALVAAVAPGLSGRKAWRVGVSQHRVLPGPNAGWSEAAVAGAIERRLVGPIWKQGVLVTDVWLGDPGDPPVAARDDVRRAMGVVTAAAAVASGLVAGLTW